MGPGPGRKGTMADVIDALHPFSSLLCPSAAAVGSSGVCAQVPTSLLFCLRLFSAPTGQHGSSWSLILPKGKTQPMRDGHRWNYTPDFPVAHWENSEL